MLCLPVEPPAFLHPGSIRHRLSVLLGLEICFEDARLSVFFQLAGDLVTTKKITEEKFLTARTLFYDGLADIALQTGKIETAETLYKETMKGCLMQVTFLISVIIVVEKKKKTISCSMYISFSSISLERGYFEVEVSLPTYLERSSRCVQAELAPNRENLDPTMN